MNSLEPFCTCLELCLYRSSLYLKHLSFIRVSGWLSHNQLRNLTTSAWTEQIYSFYGSSSYQACKGDPYFKRLMKTYLTSCEPWIKTLLFIHLHFSIWYGNITESTFSVVQRNLSFIWLIVVTSTVDKK